MPSTDKKFQLTRIAPTPSGFLHLGNVYSFALTAAIAEATCAEILLRVDDLDRDRVDIAYVNDIFETLTFLNISWHQGPRNIDEYKEKWSQLLRLDKYQPALDSLAKGNHVFACTCSRKVLQAPNYECRCEHEEIPLDTPLAAWRIRTDGRLLNIKTLNEEIIKTSLSTDMKNFIVRKKDGFPAYQLTSLIDDVGFGVDLIVRGDDLWPSTIAQSYLASILGIEQFKTITFHHHALLKAEGAKLSKSAGATSVQYLRQHGVSSKDVYVQIGYLLQSRSQFTHWRDFSNNF